MEMVGGNSGKNIPRDESCIQNTAAFSDVNPETVNRLHTKATYDITTLGSVYLEMNHAFKTQLPSEHVQLHTVMSTKKL